MVVESGHLVGLFKSKQVYCISSAQRSLVGEYDMVKDWEIAEEMGVTNYVKLCGWMYIGPQGIVHGTFNTLLNADV